LDGIIPNGQKVRRSFSFWPGEKSTVNRAYRRFVDQRLAARYRLTDYFFALSQCLQHDRLKRVEELARNSNVELMTHPEKPEEYRWLMGDECLGLTRRLQLRSYAEL
jgi:chitin disaccharide deacetylase